MHFVCLAARCILESPANLCSMTASHVAPSHEAKQRSAEFLVAIGTHGQICQQRSIECLTAGQGREAVSSGMTT